MRPQYCVPPQSIEHSYVAWMALIKWLALLDAEVVNVECEDRSAGGMFPESGSLGHGLVAESFDFSDELVKSDDT